MNTFDIYLKGGQVVTVETAHSWKEIMEYAFFEDERDILLTFNDITIVKSHISAIKDTTRLSKIEEDLGKRLIEANKPYKPWEEQKTDAINLEGRGTTTVNKQK